MKVGIFSDVHGHLNELEKTLELFRRLQVDEIVCCGDLVDKGPHSDAVVERMREENISCVQGNHDAKAQFTWLAYQEPLQSATLSYLAALPPTMTFEWEGKTAFVCHANPWLDTSVYIYPDSPMALYREIANAVGEDILIFGHTHQPLFLPIDDTLLINPGSIYGNRHMEERTCGVLSLPDCEFTLYDLDRGCKLPLP